MYVRYFLLHSVDTVQCGFQRHDEMSHAYISAKGVEFFNIKGSCSSFIFDCTLDTSVIMPTVAGKRDCGKYQSR